MKLAILKGLIYRFKRGMVSAYAKNKKYQRLTPAEDWNDNVQTGDCWIVDDQGRIDPGLNVSPVPIARDSIGMMIGRMP